MRGHETIPVRIRMLERDADQVERQQSEDSEWRKMITRLVITTLVTLIIASVGIIGNLLYQISVTKAAIKP